MVLCAAAVVGGAAASVASAEVIEIGKIEEMSKPGCPGKPCYAVSRTTGYQAKVGPLRGLMVVPKNGRLVAWSISLGKPGTKQIEFFDSKLGGESQAQITILDPKRKLRSRAVAQGPPMKLQPYFGGIAQFPLETSIPVKKGQIVALTVLTWAPALATNLGNATSWRASREKGQCEDTVNQTSQLLPNQLAQYYCLYRTARLTYSATMVTTPKQTNPAKPK
ncbi:unannotated protein [freshwater metagenome]|uniref:Unannotated protein n=1 Tax=freshwater metagenome TaxID=449393 RepID=A0A6J7DXG3_9ZZZZ|nr:hypothetical protein [Actinomycetota bacterium]